jgi:alpha-methylacyl-CoA racemase
VRPLDGIRVLDLSLNSPGPLATMMLSDFGADVIHIVRPGLAALTDSYDKSLGTDPYIALRFQPHDAVMRNKRSLALNLKSSEGRDIFLKLVDRADVLVEEMRPGKMAKLRLDYDTLKTRNPNLIYCSITGYGQTGPLASAAGHDITYLACSGLLEMSRREGESPTNPQAAMADNGGGSMSAVAGILLALIARRTTGRGQHIDVSMTDAVQYLTTDLFSTVFGGATSDSFRGSLMGAYPHYGVYLCADHKWVAVGALESSFSTTLFDALGRPDFKTMLDDTEQLSTLKQALVDLFLTEPRDYWVELVGDNDAILVPVLSIEEAAVHAQTQAREMVVERHGLTQVGIAPKLSETPGNIDGPPATPGAHSEDVLTDLGLDTQTIADLRMRGITD